MYYFRTENRFVKKVNPKSQWMRALNDGEHQMLLDAGQKKYGAVQCSECLMVYHVKDPEDELIHAKMHDIVNDTLKFSVRIWISKFYRHRFLYSFFS